MRHLLPLLLAGCAMTPMDWNRQPDADWPALKVQVVQVERAQLLNHCAQTKYASGITPVGCSNVDFPAGTCTIYVVNRDPDLIAHETGHCRGFDHPGESTMHDAWRAWRK